MSAGGEADDTNLLRVDFPRRGVRTGGADGLLRVEQRDVRTTGGQAVFEDDTGDTVGVEPGSDAMAFALGHQSAVAATGADHDRGAVRLLGQVYRKLRLRRVGELTISFRGVTFPERQGFGGKGRRGEREESEEAHGV